MALNSGGSLQNITTSRLLNKLNAALANTAADITTATTSDIVLFLDADDSYTLKYGDSANLREMIGTTATAAELNYLDITTLGTGAASKAVVLDANGDYIWPSGQLTFQTAHSGLLHGAGASGSNHSLGATADNAMEYYLDATHTTGDMRGMYLRLYFSGAGGSGEAARIFGTVNNVSVATGGTVNGAHISLSATGASAGISGAGNALRATFGAGASTNVGGTCSVIQVDTDFDAAATLPTNFAFLRFTNSNTGVAANLMRIPNASNGTIFAAHTTQVMSHSIKIVSEDGTAYYVMCTDTATNRS